MNSTNKAHGLKLLALLAALAPLAFPASADDSPNWRRWGGPDQNFRAPAFNLAESWPAEGPRRLWSRELGDGYSTILVENGRLYTMYRAGDDEAVICLDAATGETIWERRYDHDPHENHVTQFGVGPRATPLLSGDRLYTIGVAGLMHSLDKATGEIAWSKNLWGEEFGGNLLPHGYASSPVEYGETIIALVGGDGAGLVAFDKSTGAVVWKSGSFDNSYSTPQVLEIAGRTQLVTFMAKELIGIDPGNGELLWSYPLENQFEQNINPPTLVEGRYLFLSSLQAGSRGLELTSDENGAISVNELWATRKVQFYHVTSVGDGDYVYGTSGGGSPAFMSAINVKTGEVPWRRRGFAKANTVYADGYVIVLDEDGKLYLTTATPEDITIHSQAELLDRVAWTAPTVVGRTMYVRDKARIMALDLGVNQSMPAPQEAVVATAPAADPLQKAGGAGEASQERVADAALPAETASAPQPDPDEPEALRILRRADAATRAVQSVRYRASSVPSGVATNFVTPAEGEVLMSGWTGAGLEKYRTHIATAKTSSAEAQEFTAGGNGDLYYLVDHPSKKIYVDMDPNVIGSSARTVGSIQMIEFVHPTPFSDEINGDNAELQGIEKVAGVDCYKIDVTYSGGQGRSIWYFSTADLLPRRRVRIVNTPDGDGSIEITISDLTIAPEVTPGAFEVESPEGYQRIDDFAP